MLACNDRRYHDVATLVVAGGRALVPGTCVVGGTIPGGSTIQLVLLGAPFLVFTGRLLGTPMDLAIGFYHLPD